MVRRDLYYFDNTQKELRKKPSRSILRFEEYIDDWKLIYFMIRRRRVVDRFLTDLCTGCTRTARQLVVGVIYELVMWVTWAGIQEKNHTHQLSELMLTVDYIYAVILFIIIHTSRRGRRWVGRC